MPTVWEPWPGKRKAIFFVVIPFQILPERGCGFAQSFPSKDEPEGGEGRAKFGKSFLF